uniref:Phospho-2-dehydro-3-deoxyheptonate aldolase n=3 Tax=Pseudo-nitzschia australis TaxID=44445 RepID=A0A7S4ELK8_9STRA|mmetsp:Transcript_424/g.1062  ORF Transcript_424/g.1062 Transcript_424/m.1062 type:complete len:495 (+) Transcript_424:82-1566(+)|eukprot:CAMPEP_0168192758 /NCGR_PEP_ID=MMETSP0139_2-20121125/18221_1 /TAXON_ID=44445 /ORGANISM="Pseudo-nitzschia australis, Strain 10249 10 AB" /LENGTH=494 /DNA_ID=CAMNT_0008116023 /DNA_START=25 /DNA_END=1509 /DNA_ORIENTATION=+
MKLSIAAAFLCLGIRSSEGFAPQALTSRKGVSLNVATETTEGEAWSPTSWKSKSCAQPPKYEDQEEYEQAITKLEQSSPLVFAGEVRTLHEQLARACSGQGFLLMGGDCAEAFNEFDVDHVRDSFRVLLQMALVLTFGSAMPIIKVGRMAGQFAKPRSEPDEVRDGVTLPSYRGDIINNEDFTAEARRHKPFNMVQAYHQSAQTLNILRAFSTGGYADISRLHAWNLDFVEQTDEGSRYRTFATKVDESLRFMKAIGVDTAAPSFTKTDFFTAHECLLLPYEQALTRKDSTTGRWYDCSAHMLWVGERTRQLDGAHLEFCRGVNNPLGVKISDKCTPEELISILDTMNPNNIPGRLTIVVRMGAEKLRKNLPGLIRVVQREGKSVLWISDPVHGNTRKTEGGYKTRDFEKIRDELRAFFDVHDEMGSHPGGVHLEMTGEDVTECVGGLSDVTEETLKDRYNTYCDPRLNGAQALELAFLIAERMRSRSGLPPIE